MRLLLNLDKTVSFSSYLFVFSMILIPSSSLNEIKLILFCLVLLILTVNLYIKDKFKVGKNLSLFFIVFLGAFVISILISIIEGNSLDYVLRAFVSYFGSIGVLFMLIYIYALGYMNYENVVNIVVKSSVVYIVLKIIICTVPVFVNVNQFGYLNLLESVIPIGTIIWYEGTRIIRINLGNDIIIIFFSFVVWLLNYKSGKFKLSLNFLLLLNLANIFITVTRYFLVVLIIFIFSLIIIYFVNIAIRRKIDTRIHKYAFFIVLIGTAFLLISPFVLFRSIDVINLYITRFGDITSINVKNIQSMYLIKEWLKYPILGKGLGSFVEKYIRSEQLPFQYESQWFSFLMQFGIIGIVFIFLSLLLFFVPYRINNRFLLLLFYMILFLLSGFTNPYLLILNSSIWYFFVHISLLYYSKIDFQKNEKNNISWN